MLDTDVLTHMNQVKGKLKDEHLAKHETQAMLKDKHVRIIALSDVSHELSNQEVDSWIIKFMCTVRLRLACVMKP